MKKYQVKLIAVAIAAVLLAVVVFQNRSPVETKLLMASVEMPQAVLLFLTAAIGFTLGVVTAVTLARKQKNSRPKD
jgi:uncharacterized integral membrane protein